MIQTSLILHPSSFALAAGFVTPGFAFAGLALLSLPIIIHLLNRRRFKTVEWAAMEFLLRALKKNRKRIRFEQWLLLATRCLLLAFLGLALARPIGCNQDSLAGIAAQRIGLHVIVIDNSFSMRYEADRPDAKTHLDQAKLLANRLIDQLSGSGEAVVIVTASKPASSVFGAPTYDLAVAKSAVARIEPSFASTDLSGALELALEVARRESRQPNKSLYILSDATRSAWEVGTKASMEKLGRDLAGQYQITHFNLSKSNQSNTALLDVASSARLLRQGFNSDLIVTLRGFGSTNETQLTWRIDDQSLPTSDTVRPGIDTAPMVQSRAQFSRGGLHAITVALTAEDRLPVDNARYRIADVASGMKVLIVEGDRGVGALAGSGAFLSLALSPPVEPALPTESKSPGYVIAETASDLDLENKVLADYRCIILANVGSITERIADAIKQFVENGGGLIIFTGESVASDHYNQILFTRGLLPGPLARRMSVTSDQKPFYFDFRPDGSLHPFLNIFRNQPNVGLDTAGVSTYWRVDLNAESKAQRVLDFVPGTSGERDPAITVHAVGAGQVIFVATSANAEWTTLPGKPAFVTLVHEMLAGIVATNEGWTNLQVGQRLIVPPTVQLTTTPVLKDSQQQPLILEQSDGSASDRAYRTTPLLKPGLYNLWTGIQNIPISVNVPADESDVRPVTNDAIRSAIGGVEIRFLDDQLPAAEASDRDTNDFGWTFMILVLVLVGVECFLAMKFGHHKRLPTKA